MKKTRNETQSNAAASETPLRVVVSSSTIDAESDVSEVVRVGGGGTRSTDARVQAILPTERTAALATDEKAFRTAYRLELFSNASAVGEVVAAHRHAPLLVIVDDSALGRALASVLDEFFAAWAPC